jgi:hypothetical protein
MGLLVTGDYDADTGSPLSYGDGEIPNLGRQRGITVIGSFDTICVDVNYMKARCASTEPGLKMPLVRLLADD